jgi:hypothetical protein
MGEPQRTLTDDASQVMQVKTVAGRAKTWLWEQEAPGSNPGIPTISAAQKRSSVGQEALKIV